MQQQDKHTWVKNGIEPNEHVCTTCGCTRLKQLSKVNGRYFSYYIYERSGITFAYDRPDCIDWEAENNKTID